MNFYDAIANIQKSVGQGGPKPGPFNSDGKVNFGTAHDIAKGLPKQPAEYSKNIQNAQDAMSLNDKVESVRAAGLAAVQANLGKPSGILGAAAAGATLGTVIPGAGTLSGGVAGAAFGGLTMGTAQLDKATNGGFSKAMQASTKGLRSNYAFVRDVAKHNTAMGLLSGLGIVAGAVLGGAAVVATGGAAAPAVVGAMGAFGAALGAYGAGKIEREGAKAGAFNFINPNIRESAILSSTQAGQEKYNFGRDVVRTAAKTVGWKELADTSKGFGAVLSGGINFVAEGSLTPDIKGFQLAGKAARYATSGGIMAGTEGLAANIVSKAANKPALQVQRMQKEVEIVNKTVAGEQTVYTPLFKFISENDAATVGRRFGYKDSQAGQVVASIIAKRPIEEVGLIYRATSLGDVTAMEELATKHASIYNQILRYENVLSEVEGAANRRVAFGLTREDGTPIVLGNKMDDHYKLIDNELNDIRTNYSEINRALSLFSGLAETGVSKIDPFLKRIGLGSIEEFRNDVAKNSIAAKLAGKEYSLTERETALGNTIQKIFTTNSRVGAVIRFVERSLDDKAHQTVPFNNSLVGNSRVRTTLRDSINLELVDSNIAKDLYGRFAKAVTEGEKTAIMNELEQHVFDGLAAKHGVPKMISDFVLAEYLRITKNNRDKAKQAYSDKKAYMVDEDGNAIGSAQLVTQLANGHYLPNVELFDKAFKRFKKLENEGLKMPTNLALGGKLVYDNFQSIWRGITLARVGFPINIMRDTALRAWGDASLFYMIKDLSATTIHNITNSANRVADINNWVNAAVDKNFNLRVITNRIDNKLKVIEKTDNELKASGYDPTKATKLTPAQQNTIEFLAGARRELAGLRMREQELLKKTEKKIVGRNPEHFLGYDIPHGSSGVAGKISYDIIRGEDNLRGLLSSNRDLAMENISRSLTGGEVLKPTEFNEKVYMKSWENLLNNQLAGEPVAEMIMKGKSKQEIISWIKSQASQDYIQRFGFDKELGRNLRYSDSERIYERVLQVVNQFAPDSKLWEPLLKGELNVRKLKQMYPDWQTRPDIISDMGEMLLGRNILSRVIGKLTRDIPGWLASQPTSKLMYQPYFNVKYNHKFQSLIAHVTEQGRIVSEAEMKSFERMARNYAVDQFQSKINAFNRDMNYPGIMNHLFAFFPAIVEQFKAYGRLTVEHPEFPLRAFAVTPTSMANVPYYLGDVQKDSRGNEFIEVTLPFFNMKARISTSWFNPINPTGGHLLSAGPITGAVVNQMVVKYNIPDSITNGLLPFGAQPGIAGYLEPTVARRSIQLYQAFVTHNSSQLNIDTAMFMDSGVTEFVQEHDGNSPVGDDIYKIYNEAQKKAMYLAAVRWAGSLTLPAQPSYTTTLGHYSDIFNSYMKEYGQAGSEKFAQDYPEYFMIMDKLSSNTSGINQDLTSVTLAKNNKDTIARMVAQNKNFDLKVLGAVFNDADYQLSSSARAWLQSNTIPGTGKKFQEQSAALDNSTSAVVNNGWREWRTMIKTIEVEMQNSNPPLSSSYGYGKAIMDSYKQQFIEGMKTRNKMWYDEKKNADIQNNEKDLISSLTIAANTPKLWKELAKQTRWHSIVDYLNMRYKVHDELKRRGTSINSNKAADIREQVGQFVDNLRKTDINFGDYYDRYFDGDQFKFVFGED